MRRARKGKVRATLDIRKYGLFCPESCPYEADAQCHLFLTKNGKPRQLREVSATFAPAFAGMRERCDACVQAEVEI